MLDKIGPIKTQGWNQGIYAQSVTQKENLNAVRYTDDGRCFAYARAGAVALGAAKLTQNSIVDTNARNVALSAAQSAAIGDMSVTVTFGGAVTADYYKDGWFHINDATGEGHIYRIRGHAAGTASVVLYLYDPIRVALVASTSEWTCTANIQNLVIVCPTTLTGVPVGVPLIPVTINYYFWNQVKGPCPVLVHGTIVIGNSVGPSSQSTPVAGAVEALATSDVIGSVGTVLQVNADTEEALINLAIPGY
jgi:hypothetical protein